MTLVLPHIPYLHRRHRSCLDGGRSGSSHRFNSAESKRILGIIPNYRTSPRLTNCEPVTASEKFKLATEDPFHRGTVALAVLFGGDAQLTNSNRAFGQGAEGFGR